MTGVVVKAGQGPVEPSLNRKRFRALAAFVGLVGELGFLLRKRLRIVSELVLVMCKRLGFLPMGLLIIERLLDEIQQRRHDDEQPL